MKIEIPAEEWFEVNRRVSGFLGNNEANWSGHIELRSDGSTRRWTASNRSTMATLLGGHDSDTYVLLVPNRLVDAACRFCSTGSSSATLSVVDRADGPSTLEVEAESGTQRVLLPALASVNLIADVEHQMAADRVTAEVGLVDLAIAVSSSMLAPAGALDEGLDPLFNLSIHQGEVEIWVNWQQYGFTEMTVPASAEGDSSVAVPPRRLSELLDVAEEDQIELSIPASVHDALAVVTSRWIGLVMPIDTSAEHLRPGVEEVMVSVFGEDVVHRDSDGDYCLSTRGVPVYARLIEGRPPAVQVFAVVLHDVEITPELLAELNDQNSRVPFVRLIAVNGQVLAESDLVAESLDDIELRTSFERVGFVADEISPMMGMAFGGQVPTSSEQARWKFYEDTVVTAELVPESWVDLSGPDAIDEWPFDDVVHVISAANPFGRMLPDHLNASAHGRLAGRLSRDGLGHLRAVGRAASGNWAEDGLLVWGLEREDAREVGRMFGQEAIFEITPDERRIVSCFGDEEIAGPRTESAGS